MCFLRLVEANVTVKIFITHRCGTSQNYMKLQQLLNGDGTRQLFKVLAINFIHFFIKDGNSARQTQCYTSALVFLGMLLLHTRNTKNLMTLNAVICLLVLVFLPHNCN